jgi:adenosylcobinamide amidohydrolase
MTLRFSARHAELPGLELVMRRDELMPGERRINWPTLCWRAGPGWRMIASTVLGGGLGHREWWLNAQVPHSYAHPHPDQHAAGIGEGLGLRGSGVAMLTAAEVTAWQAATDGGIFVVATVGLGRPTWAAAPADTDDGSPRAGTINLLVVLPVSLADTALVGAVATVTEAKTQALIEAGIAATGTASDAVCVACPGPELGPVRGAEPYAGPRSVWGSRIARAVHTAVAAGAQAWGAT